MLLPVDSHDFHTYCRRLSHTIMYTTSLSDLQRLVPSLALVKRQASTPNRIFHACACEQDYHFMLTRLTGHIHPSTRDLDDTTTN